MIRKLLIRCAVASVMGASVWFGDLRNAQACSCIAPEVDTSYSQNSDVIYGRVLRGINFGTTRYYAVRVMKTFKGCLSQGDTAVLVTPRSSAACGARFRVGQSYLINGQSTMGFFNPTLEVSLCDYNLPVRQLTRSDRDFLNERMVCCGDDCNCADGSDPVNCLVDPCEVAEPCAIGECVANYCGGCNAEFFDEMGNLVCLPGECAVDEDCPEGSWCRGTNEGSSECAPFVAEGESCEGFTMPSDFELCQEPLVCDFPEETHDLPGTCRSVCADETGCDASGYCATDALCHEDGSCDVDLDCEAPGNDYTHIQCVGQGICVEGQCGWDCDTTAIPE